MNKFWLAVGGRKFALAVATYVGNGVLLWMEKLDGNLWRDAFIATIGAYIVGNVYQKVKGVPAP